MSYPWLFIHSTLPHAGSFNHEYVSNDHHNKNSSVMRVRSITWEHIGEYRVAIDFMAGCLGGIAGVLVSHPLDTVKVHLQTQDPINPKYAGTFDCIRKVFAESNLRGLYKGMSSPLTGLSFVNAIVFGVYGNVQRLCRDPNSLESHALAGAVAGFCQSFICSPMELAKTRIQLQDKIDSTVKHKSSIHCIVYIIRTEGLGGTLKGLLSTVLRDIPGFGAYFYSYEFLLRQKQNPGSLYYMIAGGIAGMCSWIVSYPVDVVKTCIQGDNPAKPQYAGYIDCIRQGYRSQGWPFFTRGLISTMIRSFPMNAVCFLVVSNIMNIVDDNPKEVP